MKYSHYFILGMLFILVAQACTERMICPAYQSAFIHDEEVLRKQFSYFNEDSMPKVLEASKDKYLLLEPMTYRQKMRSLETIPMRDIYLVEEDSLEFDDELLLAEQDVRSRDLYDSADLMKDHSLEEVAADSTVADSTYKISIKKEKFNIDQELYLWYLRKYLVYPDVRLQMEESLIEETTTAPDSTAKKKGFFGFFKNLFKKKKKKDEAVEGEEGEEELETSATELEEEEPKKKKGAFSFLKKGDKPPKKKKEKRKKEQEEPGESDLKIQNEEDEDDGEGDDDF